MKSGTTQLQISLVLILAVVLVALAMVYPMGGPDVVFSQENSPTPPPTPTLPCFSCDPVYGGPPTSIPDITLPDIGQLPPPPSTPQATPSPLVTPQLPDLSLSPTPVPTLAPIDDSISLSYSTPASISSQANITASNVVSEITGLLMSTQATISGVVSYTNLLSSTVYSITLATDTLNTDNAPAWYAPDLPRPMADVGWRFEQMGTDVTKRYSIAAWGIWTAEVLALPVKFVKGLSFIAELFGPFGLFLAWLLIMFPVVLVFRAIEWLKVFLIQIVKFIHSVIKLIGDIWDMFPFA